jgi:hypothetical protein
MVLTSLYKEATLVCEGDEDGIKKVAKYKVHFKDSKLVFNQVPQNSQLCYDYEFRKQ